jgi:hypothetical protein
VPKSLSARIIVDLYPRASFGPASLLQGQGDVAKWTPAACIDAAIEVPAYISVLQFDELVRECWKKVDWGRERIDVIDADRGWINYMLKRRQKSGLENWFDCIDWEALHNPIVDYWNISS